MKGGRALLEVEMTKFALNRILVSLFYFWLGCYIMDIAHSGFWQTTLARVTGILAWVVSAGNLAVSCMCGSGGALAQGQDVVPAQATQATAPKSDLHGVRNSVLPSAPDLEAGTTQAVAPPGGWNKTWSHKNRQKLDATNAPEGGWNTAFTNPFGGN